MNQLADRACEACGADAQPIAIEEERGLLAQLPGWQVVEIDGVRRLQRRYGFPDFARALAFSNRVGELAEAEDHHPSILTEWGAVTVTWWTHRIGGLHVNDFILAARSDAAESA